MKDDHSEHLTTTEARGGTNQHMGRVVLFVGTGLVVVIFAVLFFVGSL
ncbi:hypothetical protein H8M03_11170 [Sphingomonas sabuli]|uniref:Uncharacterized protein n=1 Tax=Sphingomonas sabuli TaxID=2764186 RepID=A0A7G9L1Q2_9SPHN|nr:hypothetical protein [Sphingomonas sabuli]QNM82551.1 hypothetical protein H8M03_11170 [Sphingomonas sabuli]